MILIEHQIRLSAFWLVNGSTTAGIAKSYTDRRMRRLSLPHLASDDWTHVGGRARGKALFDLTLT